MQVELLTEDEVLDTRLRFLSLISEGTPEINAAIECGWSPKQLRGMMQDPETAELIEWAKAEADGKVEKSLYYLAHKKKNLAAITLWLHNRQPGRWRPAQRIEISGKVEHTHTAVASIREAALALLNQVGPQAMQALPPVIDVESYEITDDDDD
jgi:hypothetical protein